VIQNEKSFNRASINISQVHYDDEPEKGLGSATAISSIVHPQNPKVPSLHLHISWTSMKSGQGYWRLMADLNPSLHCDAQDEFKSELADVAGVNASEAFAQGDRYFYIPVLERHRGVVHFYLEQYSTGSFEADAHFATSFGERVIAAYGELVKSTLALGQVVSSDEQMSQLEYHTLYFFQVLTLDRGTTSGLLVHDQNDLGILGSLPSHVSRPLLASWVKKMPKPQGELLTGLLSCLAMMDHAPVGDDEKKRLAAVVREHYQAHPEALDLQARGDCLPPTVANHTKN
jgi:coproporphyrinogen III oxidase